MLLKITDHYIQTRWIEHIEPLDLTSTKRMMYRVGFVSGMHVSIYEDEYPREKLLRRLRWQVRE